MGVTIDSRCLSKRCEASWHLSNMLVSALSIAPQSPPSLSAATCSCCVSSWHNNSRICCCGCHCINAADSCDGLNQRLQFRCLVVRGVRGW